MGPMLSSLLDGSAALTRVFSEVLKIWVSAMVMPLSRYRKSTEMSGRLNGWFWERVGMMLLFDGTLSARVGPASSALSFGGNVPPSRVASGTLCADVSVTLIGIETERESCTFPTPNLLGVISTTTLPGA